MLLASATISHTKAPLVVGMRRPMASAEQGNTNTTVQSSARGQQHQRQAEQLGHQPAPETALGVNLVQVQVRSCNPGHQVQRYHQQGDDQEAHVLGPEGDGQQGQSSRQECSPSFRQLAGGADLLQRFRCVRKDPSFGSWLGTPVQSSRALHRGSPGAECEARAPGAVPGGASAGAPSL